MASGYAKVVNATAEAVLTASAVVNPAPGRVTVGDLVAACLRELAADAVVYVDGATLRCVASADADTIAALRTEAGEPFNVVEPVPGQHGLLLHWRYAAAPLVEDSLCNQYSRRPAAGVVNYLLRESPHAVVLVDQPNAQIALAPAFPSETALAGESFRIELRQTRTADNSHVFESNGTT